MRVRSSVYKPFSPYFLPALSVFLLTLTCYPWRCDWLIWVALAPFFAWACDSSVEPDQRFKGALFVGTAYHFAYLTPFLSLGWWGWGATDAQSISRYFSYARVFMAVLIAAVSVWGGVVLWWLSRLFARFLRRPLIAVWAVPAVWVFLLEYVGHRTVFGFGWGLIGNRLHGHQNLRQLAAIAGVYGLSFIVVAVNTALAGLITVFWQEKAARNGRIAIERKAVISVTCLAAGLLAVCWAYGHWVMAKADYSRVYGLRTALLQGSRTDYSVDDFTGDGLDKIYSQLLDEALSKQAQLIVLPETVWLRTLQLDAAAPFSVTALISVTGMATQINRHLQGREAIVAFGIDATAEGRFYNATAFWDRTGFLGAYRKRRLVPFAEYRPAILGFFAPANVIHGGQFTFAAGLGAQLVRAQNAVFGCFICQEVMFPSLVRQTVKAGAQLLVTTGNDSVFDSPAVAYEQANLAVLRAVENGRYLVRSMKSGISAVIDPQGRCLAQLPLNARGAVYGKVYALSRPTIYTRYGDWSVLLSGLGVLLALFLTRSQTPPDTSKNVRRPV